MLADIRHAIRALSLAPGFTIVALVILALGVGVPTAMYSVVDAVVLKALPFTDEGRLVSVLETARSTGRPTAVAPQNYLDWKSRTTGLFSELGAFGRSAFAAADPDLRQLAVRGVTASLLDVLDVRPVIGARFTEADEQAGRHRVLIISDALWRRRFNQDPEVVGRTLAGADGPWIVAGVFAPDFGYPTPQPGVEFAWHPYVMLPADRDRNGPSKTWYLSVIGRLAPGVSVARANRGMATVTAELADAHPAWFENRGSTVMPLRSWLVGEARPAMLMLLAAVALVLLIACANVANLVMARGTTRVREMALRSALGASRWALTRGLLVEGLLLSTAGGGLGVLLAWWGVEAAGALLPPTLFRLSSIAINGRVLLSAAAAAVAAGVFFGLLPSWQLSRPNLTAVLGQTSSGGTSGTTARRLRTGLMVGEVAIAIVLLIGAALFLASLARVMRVDVGFDHRALTLVRVDAIPSPAAGGDAGALRLRGAAAVEDARRLLGAYPGVESVAFMASGAAPFSGGSSTTTLRAVGRPALASPADSVEIKAVSPDYFRTAGMTMVRGRGFESGDPVLSGPGALVLSELAAERFWGGDDPIGQSAETGTAIQRTVVGVVRGSRVRGPEAEAVPEIYLPVEAINASRGAFLVRLRPGAPVSPDDLRRAVAATGTVTAPTAQRVGDLYDGLLKPRRLNTVLVAVFGLLALAIAAAGIYGVMSYTVAQRAREIGVRVALGAQPSQVLGRVLLEAGGILLAGVAIGGVAAAMLARLVESFLFQVEPLDPWLYGGAVTVLCVAGLAAALVPARRASRIDPMVVLRS